MLGKPVITNKIVAGNLGIEEAKVSSIMDFFYKELNREIVEANHTYLYVRGLGTFGLYLNPVEERLRRTIKIVKGLRKGGRKRPAQLKGQEQELRRLFEIRRMIKKQRKDNNDLRASLYDSEGKLIQDTGKKSDAVQ